MTIAVNIPRMQAWTGDGIGWLVFDQPGRHNAVSQDMWAGMADILAAFERDDAVRVIVMRGAGEKAFVSGGDISEYEDRLAGASAGEDARARYHASAEQGMKALRSTGKPVICLIHGYCLGGGILIALQADIRIAADDARFSIPAAKLGIGYPYRDVEKLAQLIGPAATAEMLFTARVFDAAEAGALGLVNRVVPKAELDETVRRTALAIAGNAPLTLRAAKAAIRAAMQDPARRDRAAVDALVAACQNSADFLEGSRAFMEKRKPRFTGR